MGPGLYPSSAGWDVVRPAFRAASAVVEVRLREGWEALGSGWDQPPLLRVPLWARGAVQSGGLRGIPSEVGWAPC